MSKEPTFEPYPCAWEVRVHRIHPKVTTWKRYNIYERYELAVATVKRVEGAPLELKIVPLYAAIAKGEKHES